MDGVTVVNYSGNAEQVADASAGAVSATSTYLDAAAGWLMLVPEKVKEAVIGLREMPVDDRWLWLWVAVILWASFHFLRNRQQIVADVRRITLSLSGMVVGAIWWVLYNGLMKLI